MWPKSLDNCNAQRICEAPFLWLGHLDGRAAGPGEGAATATNGLAKTGGALGLGGILTGATTIAQGHHSFSPAGDNLGNFTATADLRLGANLLTGTGGYTGSAKGVGVRDDDGPDIGQNTRSNVSLGYQTGPDITDSHNLLSGYRSDFTTTGSYSQFLAPVVAKLGCTDNYRSHNRAETKCIIPRKLLAVFS